MRRLYFTAILFAGILGGIRPGAALADEPKATPEIVISVDDQELRVVKADQIVEKFPISTSRFGLGDDLCSYKTPVGVLEVCDKAGGNLPEGAVIKGGSFTGEVLPPDAPGRDPIVTRMIRLRGKEPQNSHTMARGIFIHGTPKEKDIGKPVSWGCIRMRSKDVVELFKQVQVGTRVVIRSLDHPKRHWLGLHIANFSILDIFGLGKSPARVADSGMNITKGTNLKILAASPVPTIPSVSSVPKPPSKQQIKSKAASTINQPKRVIIDANGTQYLARKNTQNMPCMDINDTLKMHTQ